MQALPPRAVLSVLVLSAAALAQNDHFAPAGDPFRVNGNVQYDQFWCRADILPDASLIGFAYTSGQDPSARQFDIDANPLTGVLNCNPNTSSGVQDEPETCFATDGRQLIAWSDRAANDGEIMGIFGRIYSPGGIPLGPEFQINQIWQASQWRPLIARHPLGGWVVSWSTDWDGDAAFRIVNSDGTFRTNEIWVNTFVNGAQVDTATGVASDGTLLAVFVDFSGHSGSGTALNLWARLYDANGVPLQGQEWPLNTPAHWNGEQREPRIAVDGLDRFIVVWEDQTHDGSGWGVFGRRFDKSGVPLGAEFQINTTTTNSQRNPKVAADVLGNFVVCWDDWSTGDNDIRAQRFDASATKVGPEFRVNTTLAGDQRNPGIAMTPATGHVVICFEDDPSPASGDRDVYARIYTTYDAPAIYCTAKINSLGCAPAIAWAGTPSLSGVDDFHVTCGDTLNNKSGLMFWGVGPTALPFLGGTMCVQAPRIRTPVQNSLGSGSGDDCSGTYDFFLSHGYLQAHGIGPADSLYAQYWSRDPGSSGGISLSDALSFDVTP